jgi:hypothetical protein
MRRLEGAKVFFAEEVPEVVASEALALLRISIPA